MSGAAFVALEISDGLDVTMERGADLSFRSKNHKGK